MYEFISVGPYCGCVDIINKHNLRKNSYPFDYIYNINTIYIQYIYNIYTI